MVLHRCNNRGSYSDIRLNLTSRLVFQFVFHGFNRFISAWNSDIVNSAYILFSATPQLPSVVDVKCSIPCSRKSMINGYWNGTPSSSNETEGTSDKRLSHFRLVADHIWRANIMRAVLVSGSNRIFAIIYSALESSSPWYFLGSEILYRSLLRLKAKLSSPPEYTTFRCEVPYKRFAYALNNFRSVGVIFYVLDKSLKVAILV